MMENLSLADILEQRKTSADVGIAFIERGGTEEFLSYMELYAAAIRVLSFLQDRGLQPGDELVFQIDNNRTFVVVFWASILGGIIPVPVTVGQKDEHRLKLFNIWPVLQNPWLITSAENAENLRGFAEAKNLTEVFAEIKATLLDETAALSCPDEGTVYRSTADDIAFIQFSSGSTGNPKGVVLTHRNLLVNMRAIGKAAGYTGNDSMLSWMPLTHDMGLIGFHLNPVLAGMTHYLMPADLFVLRPALWLDKATEHRVTILCSPNFGYDYVLKHCDATIACNWDLSAVRLIYNGAEPISGELCHRFVDFLAAYGLHRRSMRPVYGLAEASVAVSMSGLGEEVLSVFTDRSKVNTGDKISIRPAGEGSIPFINVGKAVEDCSIIIRDSENKAVGEGIIGYIGIKGPNVTKGYYNNKEETEKTIDKEGWLNTGDLGFMLEGSLYVTGRAKDIIFVNGKNYYPNDLERIAETAAGIPLGRIAFAGTFDDKSGKEEVLAFVVHKGTLNEFVPIVQTLRSVINAEAGIGIDRVIPIREIPRTTSGKLRRFKLLEQAINGSFDKIEAELRMLTDVAATSVAILPPENETEARLLKIWTNILPQKTIGVTQGFFELGGNSLKAAELAMALLKEWQVELPIGMLYEKQTIRALAAEMGRLNRQQYIPIPKTTEKEHLPASSAQRRLYYFWQLNKASTAYNIPVAFQVKGIPDIPRLEACIRQLISLHDTLRMSFHLLKEPIATVHERVEFALTVFECDRNDLHRGLRSAVQPFDLARAGLFRVKLFTVRPDEHFLFLDFHHIISDGRSVYLFMQELIALYAGNRLGEPRVQYADYLSVENNDPAAERLKQQEKYWMEQMEGELPVLEMPTDRQRPLLFSTEGEKIEFGIDEPITEKLRDLARRNDCTLQVVLLTVYRILLGRYTGQEEVVIGIPVAGRDHPDIQDTQGMFVNNLVFRNTIHAESTFLQLLDRQKKQMAEALQNQDYPFAGLIDKISGAKRNMGRNPLFDTMFIFQDMGYPEFTGGGLMLSRYFFDPGISKFDISMEIFTYEHSLRYCIEYSTGLFGRDTILRMAGHFRNLIGQIIDAPDTQIGRLAMLSAEECAEWIVGFNTTCREYPADRLITELIAEQVEQVPHQIAVESKHGSITYRQLDERVSELAALLVEKGVTANTVVGIFLPRSIHLVVGILGILKAGGCYLPLDSDLPAERIHLLLADSRCKIVITEERLTGLLPENALPIEVLTIEKIKPGGEKTGSPSTPATPTDLAYILYTSGTTGTPKGVMIQHRSLVNYITWAAETYCKGPTASFALFTSISFDLTVTSIFTPLITGNTIVVYEEDGKDLAVQQVLSDNKVNIVKGTPSHLKILKEQKRPVSPAESRLTAFIIGGERLDTQLVQDILDKFGNHIAIYNEYGPTEATVGCMIHRFSPDAAASSVPIGIPAGNAQVYLLDSRLQPVPIGVHGEIYISGDGLAKGYLFNEELTNQKFVPNPFLPGKRMYKTGDIGRRLPDGTLEYIGRGDQQVKINGYRIELAEIEQQLGLHPAISEALVIARPDKRNEKQLWAYYTLEKQIRDEDSELDLKGYLSARLPHHMVPAVYIPLERIPLTKNGKLDYKALPDNIPNRAERIVRQPRDAREALLLAAWREVFGGREIGLEDNFFEYGGDSIKAVQISSRLSDKGISLYPKDILTWQTIEQISRHAGMTDTRRHYEQGIVTGEKPPTPIEAWFFGLALANPNYYNQSVLLVLKREADSSILEKAIGTLIRHHDGLRLNYSPEKGRLFYNNALLEKEIPVITIVAADGGSADLAGVCGKLKSGFDITNGLLIKAAIIKRRGMEDLLFLTAHHLIIDGISWRIFLEDLYDLYTALENGEATKLPAKTASLTDWGEFLRDSSDPGRSGPVIHPTDAGNTGFFLPLDRETDDWTIANLRTVSGSLDRGKTAFLLTEAHKAYKTDMPILLNLALVLALKEWTGLDTFEIGMEGHGRPPETIDVSRTTGWFTEMYPLSLTVPDDAIGNQIKAVKEQMRNPPGRKPGIKTLAVIRMNYLGQFGNELDNDLFVYSSQYTGPESDPANSMTAMLELNSMVIDGQLRLEISYNVKAHNADTIERLITGFWSYLERISDHIREEKDLHFTPSDFDAVNLNDEELKALFQ